MCDAERHSEGIGMRMLFPRLIALLVEPRRDTRSPSVSLERYTKGPREACRNPCMPSENSRLPENDPIWAEARALEASIRAIRRAQGKKNPEDFSPDSAECIDALEEFAFDVSRVLALYVKAAYRVANNDSGPSSTE
jgi:hypothetical protein